MYTNKIAVFALLAYSLLLSVSCKKSSSSSGGSSGTTPPASSNVTVSTIAGITTPWPVGEAPSGICTDAQGNVYVSGNYNAIQKITPAGAISLFAGSPNNPGCEEGTGSSATFTFPIELCTDAGGNIYVADYSCGGIKKVTPGAVSTYFCHSDLANNIIIAPQTICADPQGNIYSADNLGEDGITKTTPGGVPSRFAGTSSSTFQDGPIASASFEGPSGICADGQGNVYVADAHRIRKISGGQVTTLAGNATVGYVDGTGAAAQFGGAMGLCLGPDGNIYVADIYNYMIRKVTPAGVVTTVTGTGVSGATDGNGNIAQFYEPTNLCFDTQGNLYVADYGNGLIRKLVFK